MARSSKDDSRSVEGMAAESLPADADAPGNAEAQKVTDRETEQGFRGVEVDPTPNENYTVSGVVDGKPTPETDPAAADEAAAHARQVAGPGNGQGPR